MAYSTSAGAVDIKPISAASDLTIDTSVTGKITLTATTGSRVFTFINSQGAATV